MNWRMLRSVLVIVLIALIVSGCSTSRTAVRTSEALRTTEARRTDTKDSVVVEQRDTLREVTTVTVDRKENGDTVRVSIMTERDRVRDRAVMKESKEKVAVKTDTVYIEKRDSVLVKYGEKERASPLLMNLKWVFWIILGLIALVILCRAKRP